MTTPPHSARGGRNATVGRDPRAWAVWLVVGALLAMSTRNPLYLILLLAVSRTVDAVCARRAPGSPALPFWRLAVAILLFSTLFNMAMSHIGTTVLFSLPASWWLIGGPITLEAAVYGFVSGLSLVTLLSFFLAFSGVLPPHRLIELVPRALHELGLVTLIALTFLPQTIQQQQRLREAQAIRGRPSDGLRGWRPIIIPLLVGGLERSLNLAETMVARGFGSTSSRAQTPGARLMLLLALALALGGALWLAWGGVAGWIVVGAGAAVLVISYGLMGRGARTTRYRPQDWTWADTAIVVAALLPLALWLPWGGVDVATLAYAPYTGVLRPEFDPLTGLLMMGLAVPAVLE